MSPLRKWTIAIVLIISCSSVFAQNSKSKGYGIGDLQIRLVDSLNLMSRDLSFVNAIEAAKFATEALKISTQINYAHGVAYAYRNLASVHASEGNYFFGMEYLQRALEIFSASKDSVGIGNCYISLGHLYRRLNSHENELFYHDKSYRIFLKQNNKERIAVTAHNLGESYLNSGDLEKSEALTTVAIRLNDSLGNKSVLSSCYKVMGRIYFERKDFLAAAIFFEKVLLLSKELGKNSQKIATAESMIYLAQIAEAMRKPNDYSRLLEEALVFAKENRLHKQLDTVYTRLISYYSAKGDFKSTSSYVNEYKAFANERSIGSSNNTIELLSTVKLVHQLEQQRDVLQHEYVEQTQLVKLRNITLAIVAATALVGFWLAFRLHTANKRIRTISLIEKRQADIIEKQLLQLEKLNDTKDKFFSIVAHDIKAPLNSLKAFVTLLAEHVQHMTKDEISSISSQLRVSVDKTVKMADDLILWAKIQMGTIEVQKSNVDVNAIIQEVEQLYQNIALQKGIKLTCVADGEMKIYANRDQVIFIIRNLVNNAIKYTSQGGVVELLVSYSQDNKVQFTIADSGIGMSLETQKKLFKLGQLRSTNGTEGEKGTGLGLILAYEFAKLNDLQIAFTSKEGVGTTFTVAMH